jgi:hypothetical protein
MAGRLLQRIDVFISSPSDVAAEREAIINVVEQLNRLSYIRQRYVLFPFAYEYDVPPKQGELPQVIIDRYMAVQDCFIFICVFWNRMGTAFIHPETGEYFQSGTEYEYVTAYRSFQKKGEPHMFLYRKIGISESASLEQVEKVNAFFDRFQDEEFGFKGLYREFNTTEEFERLIREHIEELLFRHPPHVHDAQLIDASTVPDILEEESARCCYLL